MARGYSGRYVEVPVTLAGLVAMWTIAVCLLTWETFEGGPQGAAVWGLFMTGVAMVWTVAYLLGRYVEMLRYAWEIGRGEDGELVTLPDRRK